LWLNTRTRLEQLTGFSWEEMTQAFWDMSLDLITASELGNGQNQFASWAI